MEIKNIRMEKLEIPFRIKFKHSSAERKSSESVLVICKSKKGKIGYGEGCPRLYVTGETIQSALDFFDSIKSNIITSITSFEGLEKWVKDNKSIIDANPSSWCAVELAILDVLSREKETIPEYLFTNKLKNNNSSIYSAIIGIQSYFFLCLTLIIYRLFGLTDFKLKIQGNWKKENKVYLILKYFLRKRCSLRMDGNNCWNHAQDAIEYLERIPNNWNGIEEPFLANDYDSMNKLIVEKDYQIIVDESFCKIEDLSRILTYKANYIVNIRISKMGGIVRTLNIIEKLKEFEIKYILGSQVGETSLLTRAALLIVHVSSHQPIFCEGAFSDRLLQNDPFQPKLKFGYKGQLRGLSKLKNRTGWQLECILNNDTQ